MIDLICENCGNKFLWKNKLKKNCSVECAKSSMSRKASRLDPESRVEKNCTNCNNKFTTYRHERKIFCSRKCSNSNIEIQAKRLEKQKGVKKVLSKETLDMYQSPEMRERARNRALTAWTNPETRKRMISGIKRRSESDKWKSAAHFQKGEKHPNYKGNNIRFRGQKANQYEYKKWRKDVFTRDDYTCQKCGVKATRLNAHHIREWAKFPEERFNIDNGITLCEPCHANAHGKMFKEKTYYCIVCGKPKNDGRSRRCLDCGRKRLKPQ